MDCWNCGNKNDDGYETCWFCLSPAQPPGEQASGPADQPPAPPFSVSDPRVTKHTTHRVERHTARSLDELPPEVQERIRKLQAAGATGKSQATFTIQDGDGRERTYHSLDEMPPDVRAVFEEGPGLAGAREGWQRRGHGGVREVRDASGFASDRWAKGSPGAGSQLRFWFGGVLGAGVLVGLGLAALVDLQALGASDAAAPKFLGLTLSGAALRLAGFLALAVGTVLHAALVWLNPAARRFHGLRIFLTVAVAAFLFANLEALASVLRAYDTGGL